MGGNGERSHFGREIWNSILVILRVFILHGPVLALIILIPKIGYIKFKIPLKHSYGAAEELIII